VQKLNGKFLEAIDDYDICLNLRQSYLAPNDRAIGDVHYSLAQASEYAAADKEADDPAADALRAKSLGHFEACAAVFRAMIEEITAKGAGAAATNGKGKGKASSAEDAAAPAHPSLVLGGLSEKDAADLADFKGILDELNETIASVKDGSSRVDISSVLPTGDDAIGHSESSSEAAQGVTTIGFGNSSRSAESSGSTSSPYASVGVTTIGFGAPTAEAIGDSASAFASSSSSSSSSSSTQAVMQVKPKKTKRAEEAPLQVSFEEKPSSPIELPPEKKMPKQEFVGAPE